LDPPPNEKIKQELLSWKGVTVHEHNFVIFVKWSSPSSFAGGTLTISTEDTQVSFFALTLNLKAQI
jgi:hypothetical protein